MVCHINSQITRGVFVSHSSEQYFVEILLPCLITQNMNSRELWVEEDILIEERHCNQLYTRECLTYLEELLAVILKFLYSKGHYVDGFKIYLLDNLGR